jgi:Tol biopolymer transport system component
MSLFPNRLHRVRPTMAAGAFLTVVAGVVIGCGGGGDGGPGLTSATNATASASTATASTSTATTANGSTANGSTANGSTANGSTAQGQLPPNVVLYSQATETGSELRYVSPDGTGEQVYVTLPNTIPTVGLDPVHQNVKVFAYRENDEAQVSLLRNTSLTNTGATQIVGANYTYIDQIQVSPDGNLVYFIAGVGDADSQLLSVPYGGGDVTVIDAAETFHLNQAGTKIVYSKPVGGRAEIFVRNVGSGTTPTQLTNNTAEDMLPQWSKDGSRIVFASDRRNIDDFDLFVMNANGSNQTALTTSDGAIELGASFNEQGDRIAYAALGDAGGLFTIPSAGGTPVAVKPSQALQGYVYWTTAGGRSRTLSYGLPRRLRRGHTAPSK